MRTPLRVPARLREALRSGATEDSVVRGERLLKGTSLWVSHLLEFLDFTLPRSPTYLKIYLHRGHFPGEASLPLHISFNPRDAWCAQITFFQNSGKSVGLISRYWGRDIYRGDARMSNLFEDVVFPHFCDEIAVGDESQAASEYYSMSDAQLANYWRTGELVRGQYL